MANGDSPNPRETPRPRPSASSTPSSRAGSKPTQAPKNGAGSASKLTKWQRENAWAPKRTKSDTDASYRTKYYRAQKTHAEETGDQATSDKINRKLGRKSSSVDSNAGDKVALSMFAPLPMGKARAAGALAKMAAPTVERAAGAVAKGGAEAAGNLARKAFGGGQKALTGGAQKALGPGKAAARTSAKGAAPFPKPIAAAMKKGIPATGAMRKETGSVMRGGKSLGKAPKNVTPKAAPKAAAKSAAKAAPKSSLEKKLLASVKAVKAKKKK